MITAMFILAALFCGGCLMRLILLFLDDGFNGDGVWTTLVYTSSLTWAFGLALSVLAIIQASKAWT